mmetsp:Transcript_5125/g.19199  ORF Transcript_5125/g.19199 Transcript_5125/m.19199 type:complete len:309 (+) Transcript_5125:186-1112(+)
MRLDCNSSRERWMPAMSSSFWDWRARIFSSMVPAATRRTTSTSRVCPMRWQRSTACCSTAGDHQGSQSTTRLAAVRFNPAPAALRLHSATRAPLAWKAAILARRSCTSVEPSITMLGVPAFLNSSSNTPSRTVNCEKIMIESSLLASRTISKTACTLAEAHAASARAPSSTQGTTRTGAVRQSGQLSPTRAMEDRMQSWWKAWPQPVIAARPSPPESRSKQIEHSVSSSVTNIRSMACRFEVPGSNTREMSGLSFWSSAHNSRGNKAGEIQSCRRRSNITSTSAMRPAAAPAPAPPTRLRLTNCSRAL